MTDLFFGFDESQVLAIVQANKAEALERKTAVAKRSAQKKNIRRAKSEATLAEILPAQVASGESWHVMSHGDIDALSYLKHILNGAEHFDFVAVSTWCIAKPDLEQIAAWLEAGSIDEFALFAGEIFPNQYGDEYEMMQNMVAQYGCKLVIAKNHSKVTLAANYKQEMYYAIESSANVNTKPRIEQTALHASRELFEFYKEFFDGLRSIERIKQSH